MRYALPLLLLLSPVTVAAQEPVECALEWHENVPGATCWKELENQPGCRFLWAEGNRVPPQRAGWVGVCAATYAAGAGTLELTWDREEGEHQEQHEGSLWEGRREGLWKITTWSSGEAGTYEDGKRHGTWYRHDYRSNVEEEGSYVEGQKHGLWMAMWPDGEERTRRWVHGRRTQNCEYE